MFASDGSAMPKFSVITIYNNLDTLENWLGSSLEKQASELYEFISIDNSSGRFTSAAEALNVGASKASGEYLMFVHQDVRLLVSDWFERASDHLSSIDDVGIAGVIGVTDDRGTQADRGRNIIFQGAEPVAGDKEVANIRSPDSVGPFPSDSDVISVSEISESDYPDVVRPVEFGNEISRPVPVESVDELLFIIPRAVWREYPFKPDICPYWHFYAVEYSLRINYRTPLQTYVLPLPAWHRSRGPRDTEYFRALDKVIGYYPELNYIHTTSGRWPASRLLTIPNIIVEYLGADFLRRYVERLLNKTETLKQ